MKTALSVLAYAASLSLAAPDQTWTRIQDQKHYPTGVADTDSSLWISTYSGLLEVDRKTGSKRLHRPRTFGATSDSVWSIADGGNGVLWMGLHNGSIARYDGKTWTNIPLPSSPGFTMEFVKVAMDRKGILWVHAYQRANYSYASPGLFAYDGKTWTTFSPGSMPTNPTNTGLSRSPWVMSLDTAGHVWIVSAAGFYEYTDGKWTWSMSIPGGTYFTSMIAAPDGRKWVTWSGKQGYGVEVCQPDSGCRPGPGSTGLRGSLIGSGADGDLWIGSNTVDYLIRGRVMDTVKPPPGLAFPPRAGQKGTWFVDPHDAHLLGDSGIVEKFPFTDLRGGVRSIAMGPGGSRYFATAAGPMRLQDGIWTRLPDSPPFRNAFDILFEPKSNTMAVGPDGAVWMGDFNGLWKWNGVDWTAQYHDDVDFIVFGKGGAIYTTSEYGPGILRLDSSGLTRYDDAAISGLYTKTYDLLADKAGRIWVANDSGAHYLDEAGWHSIADLRGTRIHGLAQDSSGRIWASGHGVWYLERGRAIRRFPVDGNSTSRGYTNLSVDAANRIWVTENDGGVLYLEDGRWNTITASPTGLLTNMNDCITMDADGDIWIGGPQGVSILDFPSKGGIKPALRSSGNLKLVSVPGGIRFSLDRPGGIRVQAVDGRGKSVLERNSTESAGRHFIPILARPGVLYLKLSAQDELASVRHLVE